MSKHNALATSNIRRSYSIQWKSKNHCLYSDTHDKEQWIENSMAFDFTWYKRQRSGCLKSCSCCRNLSSFFGNGKHILWDKYPEFQLNICISRFIISRTATNLKSIYYPYLYLLVFWCVVYNLMTSCSSMKKLCLPSFVQNYFLFLQIWCSLCE